MSARDFYKVMYRNKSTDRHNSRDYLDNDTEFNANHFKLFDDFSTDLRINFNTISSVFHEVTRCRRGDPNDSGIDVENGNHNDTSRDKDLASHDGSPFFFTIFKTVQEKGSKESTKSN
ncbi:hypothetical protein RR48_03691 [Papilio machaon]|uniref:Uncharacterized protein n=1 Tax=Papilio machaon TaxID=76193 RepID=A0A0N0PCN5_PAPMA|nr:hypothetical protein RR48_03691 [Papilio machaon]